MKKQKNKKQKNEDNGMSVSIIGKVVDMVKSLSDLSKSVIDAGDPEKYAKSITDLRKGVDSTYETMRKIIMESNKFTEEEKLQKLEELANQELESQKKCDEAIKGNREHVADIAMEALKGFMTCGLYFVPAMLKNLKLETLKGKNNSQLEEPINPDKITE